MSFLKNRLTPNADPQTFEVVPFPLFIVDGFVRLGYYIGGQVAFAVFYTLLTLFDNLLVFLNLFSPRRRRGQLVPPLFSPKCPPLITQYPFQWLTCVVAGLLGPQLCPKQLWEFAHWNGIGSGNNWGQGTAPPSGASRCACPALNAMANHGILPRDGRHITPEQLTAAIYRTYSLSPSLALQLTSAFKYAWIGRDWFDLEDLAAEGVVQHNGSLLREDINSPFAQTTPVTTQGVPSKRLIDLYWPATSQKINTWVDISRYLAYRREVSWQTCGWYTLTIPMHIFSSGNGALLDQCVGGDPRWVRPWVGAGGYEVFPVDYEPINCDSWGLTILRLQFFTLIIELATGSVFNHRMIGKKNNREANEGWTGNPVDGKE